MESVTHLAGVAITIDNTPPGQRIIQRCSICGEKLCDNLNQAAPLGPNGEQPEFPSWPTGRMVRVTPGNPTAWQLLDDGGKLPEDSCIALVE